MVTNLITQDLLSWLQERFGRARQVSKGRVFTFGTALTCSINYSKLLGGHKYFYAIPQDMLNPSRTFPETEFGDFVVLICGAADRTLVLPRALVLDMMRNVTTRRVDIFVEDSSYVLQTTKHPKLTVTDFLNAFPAKPSKKPQQEKDGEESSSPDRIHLKIQWSLIVLGRAEGCAVWVPVNDRNLAYQRQSFAGPTLSKLPNFGFEENTRRIIQNIDVLWLTKNVIRKAFEIESTTSVYSGLLRLNDLVLAQPNNHISLYIAAAKARREKVYSQLIRPSFQSLLAACEFITFESIQEQAQRVEALALDSNARVSGLIKGERFHLPDHYVYPDSL